MTDNNNVSLNDLLTQESNIQSLIIEKKISMSQPIKMICDNDEKLILHLNNMRSCFYPNNPRYYIVPYQPPNIGYLFNVEVNESNRIHDLKFIACIPTIHTYGGYHAFFRPDCNECLNQIPNRYFSDDETLYYTTLPVSYEIGKIYNNHLDKHHALTILFHKKENGE